MPSSPSSQQVIASPREVDDVAAAPVELVDDRVEDPAERRGQLLGAALRAELVGERLGERGESGDVGEEGGAASPGPASPAGSRAPGADPGRCTPPGRRGGTRRALPRSSRHCAAHRRGFRRGRYDPVDDPDHPDRSPMTGRVFRRSLDPASARRRRGVRLHDPRCDRPRVPRRRGRGDRRQRRSRAGVDRPRPRRAGGAPVLRPRLGVHDRAARGVRGRDRAAPAGRRSGDLPGQRRLRGDRDGAEAGPRLPPRPRRDRALDRLRPLGQLPRQHDRRARPVRAAAAPPAVRGLARAVPPRLGGLSVSRPAIRTARPSRSADELAAELDRAFSAAEPGTVAAFVAEPIVGATLAAAVPPEDYWPKIAEVCRRHGVLLIADEVMTGFGRTGRWFGLDHWDVRPPTSSWPPRARPRATGRSGSSPRPAPSTTRSPAAADSSTGSPTRTPRPAPPWPGRSSGSSTRRTWSRPAGRRATS